MHVAAAPIAGGPTAFAGRVVLPRDDQVAAAQSQGQLDGLGDPRLRRRPGREPVDDHLNVVPHLAVEPQVVGQADHAAVDARPDVALLEQVVEQVAMLSLLGPHDRREHEKPGSGGQGGDLREQLLPGLGRDGPPALGTVPLAHARKEHPQIVVDLGDRAHRRAGALAARLLRDRDRRAQAGDQVDVGLGHLAEKLPGVARQALDVAPLSLGVERIEGQRAFSRPAHAGETDQPIPWQIEVDAAQIMLAGPPYDDIRSGHQRCRRA